MVSITASRSMGTFDQIAQKQRDGIDSDQSSPPLTAPPREDGTFGASLIPWVGELNPAGADGTFLLIRHRDRLRYSFYSTYKVSGRFGSNSRGLIASFPNDCLRR